jgi:hypothetical protein
MIFILCDIIIVLSNLNASYYDVPEALNSNFCSICREPIAVIDIVEHPLYVKIRNPETEMYEDLKPFVDGIEPGIIRVECGHYYHKGCLIAAFNEEGPDKPAGSQKKCQLCIFPFGKITLDADGTYHEDPDGNRPIIDIINDGQRCRTTLAEDLDLLHEILLASQEEEYESSEQLKNIWETINLGLAERAHAFHEATAGGGVHTQGAIKVVYDRQQEVLGEIAPPAAAPAAAAVS